ncbi:MAG: glycosyltransferase family 4 protein [Acidobacteria bacterium]|nr:glycosyltransferase family 4 protein [Acidobacteriota bacterium]
MRVLLLNNVPTLYFDPLFEKIRRDSGWQLTVCYSTAWNSQVGWEENKFERHGAAIILDQSSPRLQKRLGSSAAAAVSLAGILISQSPDYLVCCGYTLMPQMVALLWSMLMDKPFAVIGDSNIYCDKATGIRRIIKRLWLNLVTRRASALITIGSANRRFWESYGARPEQLFESRLAVDLDFFERACRERRDEAMAQRVKLGLSKKVVFLFAGRLVRRKHVDSIIKAALRINDDRMALVIAGGGEEFASLKEIAGDDPRVIFTGPIAPAELPLYYTLSDVLVLPAAREPWGLVINEAMACGLSIIAHRHCGAAVDLVGDDNGVALNTFSVDELGEALKMMIDHEPLLRSMQKRSQEKIAHWSIGAAALGMIRAVESSIKVRGSRSRLPVLGEEK